MIRRLLFLLAAAGLAPHVRASADSVVTFNEVQYNPAGIAENGEYVELFNQMGIKTDISGWRIEGIGYTFPAGTIVNPGAYILVAKTPTAGQFGPFTGNIGNDGQRLRLINQSDRLMDELDYGDNDPWPAGADGSGFTLAKRLPHTDSGRHANWNASSQSNGTPGTVNFPAAVAPPSLRLSEMPASTVAAWWVEIVNTSAGPVDLTGVVVSAGGDAAREYPLTPGTLDSGVVLLLDETTLGFRPADGEKVFLFGSGKVALLDSRQQTGRLRGRAEARGGAWAYPSAATPGTTNTFFFNDSVVISEIQYNPPALAPVAAVPPTFQSTPLVGYSDVWRYNSADENLPADWATTAHPPGGNWRSGTGPIGVESAALPVPLATTITPYVPATVTYYFERDFNVTVEQLAGATTLEITHEIDDGAVFYLNGVELPSRFNMPPGAVGPETLANPSVGDAVTGSLVVPTTDLVAGSNRLSVEIHQSSTTSSDIVFGLKLDARAQLTPGSPGQPLRNSDSQWLEIANRSASPVNLTGWDFEDGIEFVFAAPNTMLAPGEHACIVRDPAIFSAAYPAARVLGTFTGSMSRSGEHIVLRDALKNTADEVRYYDSGQWPEYADGGGSSLELKDLDSDNMAGGAWAASDESGRTAWRTYTYTAVAAASNGGPDGQWSEFNIGMMAAGELWMDDISVIENPAGAATQKISDPAINNAAAWRRRGNHRTSQVMPEPGNAGNNILRIVASGPTEHMHNQIETTLASAITNDPTYTYTVSFRARWVGGSNQLHSRCYFNRLAKVNVIDRPANPGTPGSINSHNTANAGPTFSGLKHSPAVPVVNAIATVTCTATDPDGVGAMTLFYSVNGGAFASTGMSTAGGGLYSGSIPGQAAGAVVQFYIRGTDTPGANEFYPALGPNSRALYKVNDSTASASLHNFRIINTNADRDFMHQAINVMSNERIEGTVIDREGDIYYGAGIRLKSSQRGRSNTNRVGYNVDFPSDGLFRGVHGGVAVDRSEGQAPGQFELLFDIMISNSGGPISRYYDFIKVLAPNSTLTGGAVLQLARYDDVFLDSQFDNGSDGKLYEYELVYYPTTADASGNKLPQPDGVVGVGVSNHGDDPERYRWHFLNKINREADDFAPIMNYCKLFSLSGAAFEAALPQRVDVDTWFRGMAYAVLTGAGDNTAGDGAQHNGIFYAYPDGRVIFLPHDMDFSFSETRGIATNPTIATLIANPARRRQYYGHLHDIITTTYNNAYMGIWTAHFAALDPAQNWAAELTFMTNRSNNVLGQINAVIPQASATFAITTASPLTVASSTSTISGNGWVDVRNIRVQGSAEPLIVTWTGNTTWQVTLPAAPGSHPVTLEAVNFSGAVIGTATITINNTTFVQPASAGNLVVSEFMYHPADPTVAESNAGFTDDNFFEYIEVQNISAAVVDLTGVRFTGGIDYDFTSGAMLQPGARLTVASNRPAFLMRYPGASATLAAGAFLNGTGLNNAGESITLTTALGGMLRSFIYDDTLPWPTAADGLGYSVVLIAPATNPDHTFAVNWRSSALPGGNPGTTDASSFAGAPNADTDQDGLSAFLEYALGTSDSASGISPASFAPGPDGFITFAYTRNTAADDVIYEVQLSTDLATWASSAFTPISDIPLGNGTNRVTVQSILPAPSPRSFTRLHVRLR